MISKNRLRIMACGKKDVDVIKELHDKEICVDASRFSRVINDIDNSPSGQRIREVAEEIVSGETLKAVREFLAIPGNKEKLDLEIERMRQAGELV